MRKGVGSFRAPEHVAGAFDWYELKTARDDFEIDSEAQLHDIEKVEPAIPRLSEFGAKARKCLCGRAR